MVRDIPRVHHVTAIAGDSNRNIVLYTEIFGINKTYATERNMATSCLSCGKGKH